MGLTRKKITVRTKRGKSFQRSVMVRAEAIGKRTGGKKLNSLNPWQTHHVEGVNTNTRLGQRQQAYGSSGPGSDHSWFAHMVGRLKDSSKHSADPKHENLSGTDMHAWQRRDHGQWVSDSASAIVRGGAIRNSTHSEAQLSAAFTYKVPYRPEDLHSPHGPGHAYQVPQNPRKHVRE